jgi:hypothetical protein
MYRCLKQYTELQEMLKEKALLNQNRERHIAITRKLNEGFKIKNSASQIFKQPIDSSMKEDFEDMKDELFSNNDESFVSSGEHRSRFISPEKRNEYVTELSKSHIFKTVIYYFRSY